MSTTRKRPLRERTLEKVDQRGPSECWPWTGRRNTKGYGQIGEHGRRGRALIAHRVVYQLLVGPVPDGLVLDHLCRNRSCCNPAHLEPVTDRENILRGVGEAARHAAQTHCVNGHPFSDANTYLRPGGTGRDCRICRRDRIQRFKAKAAVR